MAFLNQFSEWPWYFHALIGLPAGILLLWIGHLRAPGAQIKPRRQRQNEVAKVELRQPREVARK